MLKTSVIAAGLLGVLSGCAVPEEDADVATGTTVLYDRDGKAHVVTYQVQDGDMIYQGDINLGPVKAEVRYAPQLAIWNGFGGERWLNGEVDYVIDSSVSGYASAIRAAADDYNKHTPLKFHEGHRSGHFYLRYTATSGTSNSKVGWQLPPSSDSDLGGTVFLANNMTEPALTQIVTHETGHAMGFYHEQGRSDRSSVIDYDASCVSSGNTDNFDTQSGITFGDYDLTSIMEYGSWQMCDDSSSTLTTPPPPSWALRKHCTCYPLWKRGYAKSDANGMIIPSLHLSPGDINDLWHMYEHKLGTNENADFFGASSVAADFDGDGFVDLAIGAPDERVDSGPRSGVVYLFKGTRSGLVHWRLIDPATLGHTGDGDTFGQALAAGDVTGDGLPDLIVGAPNAASGAGRIYVFKGDKTGLVPLITADESALGWNAEAGDRFGAALAVGDFLSGTSGQIAVGAPGEQAYSDGKSGAVLLVSYGTVGGGHLAGLQLLTPRNVIGATNLNGLEFGTALAVGDFNGDFRDDLAVGSPESFVTAADDPLASHHMGAVYTFHGGATSMTGAFYLHAFGTQSINARFGSAVAVGNFDGTWAPTGAPSAELVVGAPFSSVSAPSAGRLYSFKPVWNSTSFAGLGAWKAFGQTGAGGGNEAYDYFGGVLAAGDVNDDGKDDLLAGIPQEDVEAVDDGAVLLFFGSSSSFGSIGQTYLHPSGYPGADGDNFGSSLAIGDFTGNGIADFAAGGINEGDEAGTGTRAGGSYIFTGREGGWPAFWKYEDQWNGHFQ